MTKTKTWADLVDWPPWAQPVTLMEMVAEARAVSWDFSDWCYLNHYDASDPDARRMFESLLDYAKREGRVGLN